MNLLQNKVPVTVLTGFLGSGKTTLLNRILSGNHGLRIAVIENEFGEVGVDQDLVVNADEEVLEMNNGCICCTVRGDLIRILGSLARRRQKFDRVLIETTGIADPGPVAQTFFVDDDVREQYTLDGIVTLVDAVHLPQQIDRNPEVAEQLAFADVVVLNKLDLVPADLIAGLEQRVRKLNRLARVVRSDPAGKAQVPIGEVLGVGGFDLVRTLERAPDFLEPEYPFEWCGGFDLPATGAGIEIGAGPDPSIGVLLVPAVGQARELDGAIDVADRHFAEKGSMLRPDDAVQPSVRCELRAAEGRTAFTVAVALPGRYWLFTQHRPEEFALRMSAADGAALPVRESRSFSPPHAHDDEVGSVSFDTDRAVDFPRLQAWMGDVLAQYGTALYRFKGVLNVRGSDQRLIVQGVHMLLDSTIEPWGTRERHTRMVFIGRDLPTALLRDGFERCLE